MRRRLKALCRTNRHLVNYCLIGASGALLDFILFLILTQYCHVYYQYANGVSVSLGILNNFIWNSLLNFKLTSYWFIRLISFYAIGMIGLGISAISLHFLIDIRGMDEAPAKILVIGIVTAVQFTMNRSITFKTFKKGSRNISP